MEGLIMTSQLVLGLAILIVLHEFGHFITARAFNIKVEKFYLFFDAWGIKLFKFKKGDTEYGIGWLPLGGYVKISGMIDESLDSEALKKAPQPWEFRSKPAWQRLIVMLGGVTVNAILGVFIISMLTFVNGDNYLPNSQLKNGIVAFELGKEIGLKTGDKIIAINNEKIERFDEILSPKVFLSPNTTLTVERNSENIKINIPPNFIDLFQEKGVENFIDKRHTFYVDQVLISSNAEKGGLLSKDSIITVNGIPVKFFDEFKTILDQNKNKEISLTVARQKELKELIVNVDENGKLGFSPNTSDFTFSTIQYGLVESFVVGNNRSWAILWANITGLGKIIKGEISPKNISSPIGIATIYGGTWDWNRFWSITGLISLLLAFMNILPIPALDGGHVLFLIVESVSGHKFSEKFIEKAQIAGMLILLAIMTFAIGNDIVKILN